MNGILVLELLKSEITQTPNHYRFSPFLQIPYDNLTVRSYASDAIYLNTRTQNQAGSTLEVSTQVETKVAFIILAGATQATARKK